MKVICFGEEGLKQSKWLKQAGKKLYCKLNFVEPRVSYAVVPWLKNLIFSMILVTNPVGRELNQIQQSASMLTLGGGLIWFLSSSVCDQNHGEH